MSGAFMKIGQKAAMAGVLREVGEERERQHNRWGEQNHPDGTGLGALSGLANTGTNATCARHHCDLAFKDGEGTYADILWEEFAEALAESDPAALRKELIQVAAVAVAWIEAIDRRAAR